MWCVHIPAPVAGSIQVVGSDELQAFLPCTHHLVPTHNKEAWAFADMGVSIGGGSHALETIGGTCAFAIDYADAAAATFNANHPNA